jgi:hypothetical protein
MPEAIASNQPHSVATADERPAETVRAEVVRRLLSDVGRLNLVLKLGSELLQPPAGSGGLMPNTRSRRRPRSGPQPQPPPPVRDARKLAAAWLEALLAQPPTETGGGHRLCSDNTTAWVGKGLATPEPSTS